MKFLSIFENVFDLAFQLSLKRHFGVESTQTSTWNLNGFWIDAKINLKPSRLWINAKINRTHDGCASMQKSNWQYRRDEVAKHVKLKRHTISLHLSVPTSVLTTNFHAFSLISSQIHSFVPLSAVNPFWQPKNCHFIQIMKWLSNE